MPGADCATMHSGKQGNRKHPGLPLRNGWNGLCRALPGERCTIAPVALRMAMCVPGRAAHITARLGAQTPGAWTTRFGRTLITPVVRARSPLTVARPAKSFAPMWPASTAARPACRDDRDTPLFLGPECEQYPSIPNFGKVEYFRSRALTGILDVLPVGQRKAL